MTRKLLVVLLVGSGLTASGAAAGDSPDAAATLVTLRGCTLEFDRSAVLGATVPGLLKECLVKPGDRVRAKQVIGRLEDNDVRAELELKESEARSDVDVRLNKAKHAQALGKLRRSAKLSQQGFVSADEIELHRLEAETASLGVEEAEYRRRHAEILRRQAEAAVRARELVAPHDGVVVAVFKAEGEPVSMNDPVLRLVNTERLRVTGQLDVTDAWRVTKGQAVRISPDIPGAELAVERESFPGKVVFVDTQVDSETRTCKVVAEVDNRDNLLRAGLHARMEIFPDPTPAPPDNAARAAVKK